MTSKGIKKVFSATVIILMLGCSAQAARIDMPGINWLFPVAHAEMSKSYNEMIAKSKRLHKKSSLRTKAAIKRMQRIIKEKRQGKYGFSKDFNTVPVK